MIKRLTLVASVCLTALLSSSCSDSGTQSGVQSDYAKDQVPPVEGSITSSAKGVYGRSAACDYRFKPGRAPMSTGGKYVDLKLNKVLAYCQTVRKYYAYWNYTQSTATLSQWLKDWCTSQYGSSTTIIDTDEQQCHSGSGAYNVAIVGYVNKYGDLVAAYNSNSGGQSKSLWGKNHYCRSGKNEGRTYSGLSASICGSTTTTTTTTGSGFEGYVNKYGDLLAAYNAGGGGQTKSAWGKTHYCNFGRKEGRTFTGLSASSCGSTTTTTTTTGTGFEGYVNKYGDLLAAYKASGGGQSKSVWGKTHYCNFGRKEGRTFTGLSASSCGSTTTTTTTSSAESCYGDYVRKYPDLLAAYNASGRGQNINVWGKTHYNKYGKNEGRSACSSTTTTTTSSWPSGNYQYLYDKNARSLSGRTHRWKSKTIQISGAYGSWRAAVDRWTSVTAVNLAHVGSTPSVENGIEIIGYDYNHVGNNCGVASVLYWASGTKLGRMYSCKIRIHPNHASKNCNSTASTITHEVGHCLGFSGHSNDNGIMDTNGSCRSGNSCSITSNTRGFINLLYALSPGADIRSRVTNLYRSIKQPEGRLIKKNGATLLAVDFYIKEGGDVEIVQKY